MDNIYDVNQQDTSTVPSSDENLMRTRSRGLVGSTDENGAIPNSRPIAGSATDEAAMATIIAASNSPLPDHYGPEERQSPETPAGAGDQNVFQSAIGGRGASQPAPIPLAVTHGPTSASTAARANGASSSEPIYVAREEPSEIPIIGFNTQGKIDNVDYRKFMRDFDIYHHKGGRYSMVECLATDDQTILFGLDRANRDLSFAQQVNKYKDNKVFDSVMRQMLVESKADYGAQMRATKMLKLTPEGKGTILTLNLYLESINVLIHDGLLDYLDDKEAYRIFMTNLRCEPVVQYIQSRLNKDVDKTKKLKKRHRGNV